MIAPSILNAGYPARTRVCGKVVRTLIGTPKTLGTAQFRLICPPPRRNSRFSRRRARDQFRSALCGPGRSHKSPSSNSAKIAQILPRFQRGFSKRECGSSNPPRSARQCTGPKLDLNRSQKGLLMARVRNSVGRLLAPDLRSSRSKMAKVSGRSLNNSRFWGVSGRRLGSICTGCGPCSPSRCILCASAE